MKDSCYLKCLDLVLSLQTRESTKVSDVFETGSTRSADMISQVQNDNFTVLHRIIQNHAPVPFRPTIALDVKPTQAMIELSSRAVPGTETYVREEQGEKLNVPLSIWEKNLFLSPDQPNRTELSSVSNYLHTQIESRETFNSANDGLSKVKQSSSHKNQDNNNSFQSYCSSSDCIKNIHQCFKNVKNKNFYIEGDFDDVSETVTSKSQNVRRYRGRKRKRVIQNSRAVQKTAVLEECRERNLDEDDTTGYSQNILAANNNEILQDFIIDDATDEIETSEDGVEHSSGNTNVTYGIECGGKQITGVSESSYNYEEKSSTTFGTKLNQQFRSLHDNMGEVSRKDISDVNEDDNKDDPSEYNEEDTSVDNEDASGDNEEDTSDDSEGTSGDNEGTSGDNEGTSGDNEGTSGDNEGTSGDNEENNSEDNEVTSGDSEKDTSEDSKEFGEDENPEEKVDNKVDFKNANLRNKAANKEFEEENGYHRKDITEEAKIFRNANVVDTMRDETENAEDDNEGDISEGNEDDNEESTLEDNDEDNLEYNEDTSEDNEEDTSEHYEDTAEDSAEESSRGDNEEDTSEDNPELKEGKNPNKDTQVYVENDNHKNLLIERDESESMEDNHHENNILEGNKYDNEHFKEQNIEDNEYVDKGEEADVL